MPTETRPATMAEGAVTLADGRRLQWAQWGVPGGADVLRMHGNPGSRMWVPPGEVLDAFGVRLTTVNRPGIGASSPNPGRDFASFVDDVEQLADALELDTFYVFGHSMGGPHALACGARLDGRVVRVAISGSPGPWNDPGFRAEPPPQIREVRAAFAASPRERAERQYREELEAQRVMLLTEPEQAISQLGVPDRSLLAAEPYGAMMRDDLAEAFAQGIEGYFEERMAGYVDPWGFDLHEVAVPVHVFHGTDDVWVPLEVGREIARHLPHATFRELRGTGHFLGPDEQRVMLKALLSDAGG